MITINQTTECILEVNKSLLLIDQPNKIVTIKWQGLVDLETAQKILMRGSDFIEDGSATKILLNRKQLDQFSKDASRWIKDDLLKNRARKLVHFVEKVASVKSSTTMGNMFSNLISTAIRIVFPKLRMKSFENEEGALDWLKSN